MLVFFFHFSILYGGSPEWLTSITRFGWTGVDLFFVLSGFLITSPLLAIIKQGEIISLKDFYLRRSFRIIPAYLFTVGIYFLIPAFREKEALPPLWKFLTFTQNLGLNIKDNGTFSHAWSLCVEEHFYLLLPVVLLLFQTIRKLSKAYWLIITLLLLGLVLRIYSFNQWYLPRMDDSDGYKYWYQYIYYPSYNRLDGLLVGITIAGLYQFAPLFWQRITKYGNIIITAGMVVLIGAYYLCIEQDTFFASVFGFPVVAIGYGLLVVGALSPSGFLFKWNSNITHFIATQSYTIYLTHKGVIHLTSICCNNFTTSYSIVLISCIFTCTIVAYLLHRLIEQPFINWRKKICK